MDHFEEQAGQLMKIRKSGRLPAKKIFFYISTCRPWLLPLLLRTFLLPLTAYCLVPSNSPVSGTIWKLL